MSFYILAGLCVGFYIAMTSVYPIISEARRAGMSNIFTSNTTLAVGTNIVFLAVIWPVMIPYFFSPTYRESLEIGFTKVIYTED